MSRIGVLKNTVSFITGGASGLGRGTVERFLSQGGRVVICDLPTSEGEQIAKSLGENCRFAAADVTKATDVSNALQQAKEQFGKLNHVVNCAGIGVSVRTYSFGRNAKFPMDAFKELLMINVAGTFNVIRLAIPYLCENEGNEDGQRGVIINTSSIAAYEGQCGDAAISAASGAINSMTLPIARDLREQGIRVNTIAPGMFLTPLLDGLPQKAKEILVSLIPFPRRFGHPVEFGHLCEKLIENPMINGETIRLDGAVRMLP